VNYLKAVKILVLLSLLVLSACGMQGDLYLPDDRADEKAESTTQ